MTRAQSAPLTARDYDTLERADTLATRFDSGIFPDTIGDRSRFVKLVRRGILFFDGWGRDVDGLIERDVAVYRMTDAGRSALEAERAARRARRTA